MGNPGATEVKGSALMFSTYLVRKSIAKACSFAFLSQTWFVTTADMQTVKQSPNIPKATMHSTNVNAATLPVWRCPDRSCIHPCLNKPEEAEVRASGEDCETALEPEGPEAPIKERKTAANFP